MQLTQIGTPVCLEKELVQGSYFIRFLPIFFGLLFLNKNLKFKNNLFVFQFLLD